MGPKLQFDLNNHTVDQQDNSKPSLQKQQNHFNETKLKINSNNPKQQSNTNPPSIINALLAQTSPALPSSGLSLY